MDRNVFVLWNVRMFFVVPYVGTWIEIFTFRAVNVLDAVVPYVGTWIEMSIMVTGVFSSLRSFPTWERG